MNLFNPTTNASQIVAGKFALARLPNGTLDYVLKGQGVASDLIFGVPVKPTYQHVKVVLNAIYSIGQGTWTNGFLAVGTAPTIIHEMTLTNTTTHVDLDNVSFMIWLNAGNYVGWCTHRGNTLDGIMEIKLDGNLIDSVDCYNATSSYYTRVIPSFNVPADGEHLLNIGVNGHNVSSTNYYVFLASLHLARYA